MEGGGDAVGEQLRLGVVQRDVGVEIDTGARLQLAFECVTVDIDDTGQHEQTSCVDLLAAAAAAVAADAGDDAIVQ